MNKKIYNLHFITNNNDAKKETEYNKNMFMNKENLWNNLTINYDKNPDYYIILNNPGNNYYKPEKSIVIHNEPISTRKTWEKWENSYNFFHLYKKRNISRWGISWSYNDLITRPIFKLNEYSNYLSTITSDLNFLPGHHLRLNMIRYIENNNNDFNFHIYGRKTKIDSILDTFKNYKGELKFRKNYGLFRYHYHFMGENSQENNYFTEKLIDPILTETLCFYWGCPNVKSYLDERAYIEVDIRRPRLTLDIIRKAIKNNEREKRLKYIKQVKKKFLTEMSIIPMINKIINKL